MRELVRMPYGSQVFGTALPDSDADVRGVFLPSHRDLMFSTATDTIDLGTKKNKKAKSGAGDVDIELYALKQYCKLLAEGQTIALDMMFIPEELYLGAPSQEWLFLKKNRHRFLHSGVTKFVGYCQGQALKYSEKGDRVAATRAMLEFLEKKDWHTRLRDYREEIMALIEVHDDLHYRLHPTDARFEYVVVVDTAHDFNCTTKHVRDRLRFALAGYGARAIAAEQARGADFKALYQAVRVCSEAMELLTTGKVTFPRPERALLLQIRNRELPYEQVTEIVKRGEENVLTAMKNSVLPPAPDRAWIDEFVYHTYSNIRPNSAR
jgi:hypothetical protein